MTVSRRRYALDGDTIDARLVAGVHRGQRPSFREFSAGSEDERREGLRTCLWTAPGEVCSILKKFWRCLVWTCKHSRDRTCVGFQRLENSNRMFCSVACRSRPSEERN